MFICMQCRKCRVVLSVVVIVPQKNATIAISILATKKLATNDRMQQLLHKGGHDLQTICSVARVDMHTIPLLRKERTQRQYAHAALSL